MAYREGKMFSIGIACAISAEGGRVWWDCGIVVLKAIPKHHLW